MIPNLHLHCEGVVVKATLQLASGDSKILAANCASRKLHEKAGFMEISRHNDINRYQYSANV